MGTNNFQRSLQASKQRTSRSFCSSSTRRSEKSLLRETKLQRLLSVGLGPPKGWASSPERPAFEQASFLSYNPGLLNPQSHTHWLCRSSWENGLKWPKLALPDDSRIGIIIQVLFYHHISRFLSTHSFCKISLLGSKRNFIAIVNLWISIVWKERGKRQTDRHKKEGKMYLKE